MLEAIAAFSLAGTIVQFVEFSSAIILKTKELSNAGTTQDIQRLEYLTNDLVTLSQTLEMTNCPAGAGDASLQDLCNECANLGVELIRRLNRLKVYDTDTDWRVMKKAVTAIWSKKELDELSRQLSSFRSQIQLHVLVSFRDQFNLAGISRDTSVYGNSDRILSALRDLADAFSKSSSPQAIQIADFLQDSDKTASNEHETTRSIILEAFNKSESDSSSKRKSRRPIGNDARPQYEDEDCARQVAEERLLQSLLYPSITARYSQVTKAHAKTFDWIFNGPQNSNQSWSNFKEWLRFENGIYWVNGKAGSGKSTLMKYLYNHSTTRKLLELWADSLPLITASFFFWNSGTNEQKSQMGLLQSLLYEVLSRHRNLIPIVLPDHGQGEYLYPTEYYQDLEWNLQNMRKAFNVLCKQQNLRICLFIDGLDEYEGDMEIVSLFSEIAASPNFKICLSSRPWLVFEDAFQQGPSLRLQDLTSSDIRQYTKDKLNSHPRMTRLRRHNCDTADALIDEILSKASGVFLWVKLVVKSLLDGLTNRDRILDLQKRLHMLPAGLGDLYKHIIFKQIDPIYQDQSSQIFQIFRAANEMGQLKSGGVDLLTLMFADEEDSNFALTAEISFISRDTLLSRCEDMVDRLKSRCGGLLEVSNLSSDLLVMKVDFLHRTVRDFLEFPEISDLRLALPGTSFDPYECLIKSYLLQLKLIPSLRYSGRDDFREPFRLATLALRFARKSRELTGNANIEILGALDQTIQILWSSKPRHKFDKNSHAIDIRHKHCWACYAEHKHKAYEDFLSVAVSYGLKEYVDAKLGEKRPLFKRSHSSLLHRIVDSAHPPEPEMVLVLLQHGEDPNRPLNGQSMWQVTLNMLAKPAVGTILSSDPIFRNTWEEICTLLLKSGADHNAIALVRIESDTELIIRFQVQAFTPLHIFSRSGPHPNPDIEALLISMGAVSVHVKSEGFDYKDAERRALETAILALSKPLHIESAKSSSPAKKISKWCKKLADFRRPISD